ncbi:MAG: VCBS repeat-containing protein [Planctomycetota bacterium]|nr:VCBS repeat-containing protein [Planctomycetota bacterium]
MMPDNTGWIQNPRLIQNSVLQNAIMISALLCALLCGCSPQSEPNLQTSNSTKNTFRLLSLPTHQNILQRNGTQDPGTILDVKSTGLVVLDLEGDGTSEILLTSGSTLEKWNKGEAGFDPQLLRCSPEGELTEIPGAAGIPALRWTCGAAAADIDADGDDDLLLTGIDGCLLLENRSGTFHPIEDSGIATESWCTSASFGDLDLDGDLDLFICRYLKFPFESPPLHGTEWSCLWENQPVLCGPRGLPALTDLVFENVGNWKFIDRTQDWGLSKSNAGFGLAVTIADLFGDPYPEIFVANDSSPNHLWTRSPDGTWTDEGLLSGIGVDQDGQEQAGMGIAVADLNGDEGLDLIVTNFERESLNLYSNQNDGTFRDIAATTGLSGPTRSPLSWGVGISDFNLDGIPDIFISNGHVYPHADTVNSSPGFRQKDQLLIGSMTTEKSVRFSPTTLGIGENKNHVGRCLVLDDWDNDGDMDVITSTLNGPPHFYRNETIAQGNSCKITLEQSGLNREAIGAKLTLLDQVHPFSQVMLRQYSFQSSGRASVVMTTTQPSIINTWVKVRWPDGIEELFKLSTDSMKLIKGAGKKD